MVKDVLRNPGGALEIGANVGSAFASRSPKVALLSLLELMNFYHTFVYNFFKNGPKLG